MKMASLLASSVLMALLPSTVYAQTSPDNSQTAALPPQQDEAQAEEPSGLTDIVVTAQRRAQNVQDVPIAITAISGETLAQTGIRDARDLTLLTPSLAFQAPTAASSTALYIRGVGISDTSANTTGTVGVYVDDVFIGANAGKLFNTFDLDGVEILKGPQGTLYGRNTTAGAIRFSSRKPTNELTAEASALYGRFNEIKLEAGVGGPIITDVLKVRVSGLYNERDGWMLNRTTGNKQNDVDIWAARAILDFTPSENLLIRAIIHAGESRGGARQFQHRGQGVDFFGNPSFLDGFPADTFGYADTDNDLNAGDYDIEGRERIDVFGASLTAELDLGAVTLTSISAYEKVNRATLEDSDASPNNFITSTSIDRPRQFSQELRLASSPDARLSWIVGGFYFNDKLKTNSSIDVLRAFRDPSQPLGGFDPASGIGNGVYPYTQKTESIAAFGQADYKLTDEFTATLGLRYSQDKIGIDYFRGFLEPEPVGLVELFTVNDRKSYQDLSWRLALNYKRDDLLLYASYSKGYNSGGFPGVFAETSAQVQPFDSERLYAYEVGFKSELLDRRLRFNASAFYYDYKDLQVFAFDTSGVLTVLRKLNAGSAELYGAEIELNAEPVDGLTLFAGATLLHSEYKDFVALPSVDVEGNQLVNAPKLAASGGIAYRHTLGDAGNISARVDALYSSTTFLTIDNSGAGKVGKRTIANARLAWTSADDRYEIAAFAKNITGKRYVTFFAPILTFDELNYNDPATYGLEFRLKL